MSLLEDWINAVCAELGVERCEMDRDLVLDLARDVAHGVARPGAPLTAYLLGLAVGRGVPARDAAARLTEMAEGWNARSAESAADTGPTGDTEPAGDTGPAGRAESSGAAGEGEAAGRAGAPGEIPGPAGEPVLDEPDPAR